MTTSNVKSKLLKSTNCRIIWFEKIKLRETTKAHSHFHSLFPPRSPLSAPPSQASGPPFPPSWPWISLSHLYPKHCALVKNIIVCNVNLHSLLVLSRQRQHRPLQSREGKPEGFPKLPEQPARGLLRWSAAGPGRREPSGDR